jgi:hypothetical protein
MMSAARRSRSRLTCALLRPRVQGLQITTVHGAAPPSGLQARRSRCHKIR